MVEGSITRKLRFERIRRKVFKLSLLRKFVLTGFWLNGLVWAGSAQALSIDRHKKIVSLLRLSLASLTVGTLLQTPCLLNESQWSVN